jgi:hypothetical protein
MATRAEVQALGIVLSDAVLNTTGFQPSTQTCNEFAMKILAEAKVAREEIVFRIGDTRAENTG